MGRYCKNTGLWADTVRMQDYAQVMRKKGGWAGEEERLQQVRRKGYDQMRSEMEWKVGTSKSSDCKVSCSFGKRNKYPSM